MPLFLQALPLALKTLPHYLLLLPFLAVLIFAFSILAFIPLVGLVVPGALTAFCAMAGFRCALAARGHGNEPDFGALLRSSLLFSLINILAVLTVSAFALGVTLITVGVPGNMSGLRDLLAFLQAGDGWVFYLQTGFVILYSAAMAVPMTAAAAAGTTGASRPDAFHGFGSGFVSLALVLGISLAIGRHTGLMNEVWVTIVLLAYWIAMYIVGGELPDLLGLDLSFALSVLAMIAASCWVFATAVLAWETTAARPSEPAGTPTPPARQSAEELRSLRESRMPGERR